MSCLVASEIGCFFGFSTNCLPQELYLNLGFPLPKLPFLAMWLEEQLGQFIVKPLWIFRSAYSIVVLLKLQDHRLFIVLLMCHSLASVQCWTSGKIT